MDVVNTRKHSPHLVEHTLLLDLLLGLLQLILQLTDALPQLGPRLLHGIELLAHDFDLPSELIHFDN